MKRITAIILTAMLFCMGYSNNGNSNGKTSTNNISTASSDNFTQSDMSSAKESGNSRILIAYFTVLVDEADTVAGASVVIKDGGKYGNTEYVANVIQ